MKKYVIKNLETNMYIKYNGESEAIWEATKYDTSKMANLEVEFTIGYYQIIPIIWNFRAY